jgi:hypothetical protein
MLLEITRDSNKTGEGHVGGDKPTFVNPLGGIASYALALKFDLKTEKLVFS